MSQTFSNDEEYALRQDREDPLRSFRERFHIPAGADGQPLIYFVGNSLGLMPKATRQSVDQELDDWARLGVDGHFDAATPWYPYHETVREPAARLVGAQPNEVVCMNSLTVNLHLLMATLLSAEQGTTQGADGGSGFPFRYLRDQIANHVSRFRP